MRNVWDKMLQLVEHINQAAKSIITYKEQSSM